MTGVSRPQLALGTLFVLVAVAAPAPATAAVVTITAGGTSPPATAPGRTLRVTAVLRVTRPAVVRLGLVLTSGSGAKGGIALGAGKRLRLRPGRRVRVALTGTLGTPGALGRVGRLLVCVDPAKAARGAGGRCRRAAGAVGIAPLADSAALIDAALAARRVSAARAVTLKLWWLAHDPRLPVVFRGRADGSTGAVVGALAARFPSLPAAAQRQVLRYFAPPSATGNAWVDPRGGSRARTTAAATRPDCRGFDRLQQAPDFGFADEWHRRWRYVPTSDGHALVWYLTWTAVHPTAARDVRDAAELTQQGRRSAIRYAAALPGIWRKLTPPFGPPQSDAAEPCYHGPDGRLDVYVDVALGTIEANGPRGAVAITMPYPAVGPYPTVGKFCTDRPAFIVADPDLELFVLAHEFMHALQLAHRYRSCDDPIAFWNEGEANWAGDYVYPTSQYEQRKAAGLLKTPVTLSSPTSTAYDYWPFWMMLQRENGIGVLNAVFAQLRVRTAIDAVGAAIPGGFAKQVPRLGLVVWNQSPVGAAGFPPKSYRAWDSWTGTPQTTRVPVALGRLPSRIFPLVVTTGATNAAGRSTPAIAPLAIGGIHDVTIGEAAVKEIQVTNALAGKPAHVDAMLQLVNGTWRLEDWSKKRTITLCREVANENVKRIVIVSSSISTHELPAAVHLVRASRTCAYPKRFSGTFHVVATFSAPPITDVYTYNGVATFVRSPRNPGVDVGPVIYDLQSGSISWTESHTDQNCSTSDSGSTVLQPNTSQGLVLENTRLRSPPSTSPTPWLYAIQLAGMDQFTEACPGATTHPFLLGEGLVVGASLTTDAGAKQSATPRLLTGSDSQGMAPLVIDQSWTFTGFDS